MTDSETAGGDAPSGARMTLEPDSFHEDDDGLSLDCPQCGTTVTVTRIIEEGHCPNYLDEDDVEVEENAGEIQRPGCSAELSLELVWED
jgi:hypothetical protein